MKYAPIIIQYQDADTEEWVEKWRVYALKVNKGNGTQSADAGAVHYTCTLNFDVRYFRALEEMRYNPQPFRIVYQNHFFKLVDYDDYMERHSIVRLVGEAYG